MRHQHYVAGTWLVVCDRCGEEMRNTALRREWTGLMVCRGCWEQRHPQDLLRAKADHQAPPWVRPRPADVILDPILTEGGFGVATEGGELIFA